MIFKNAQAFLPLGCLQYFFNLLLILMSVKVKSYGLFEGEKEIVLVYSNPSQKDFLDFQLKGCLKRLKKNQRIQFENTANGVWYCRQHPQNPQLTQIVLIAKEVSSISVASNFLNKAAQVQKLTNIQKDKEKLRGKIDDLIKLMNANSKIDTLSSSVLELQDIMKGNVNKLVGNMGELDTAQRKSSMMAELSMQFERDSKALQQKMKRRKCLMKAAIGGCVSTVLGVVIYVLFL